MRHSNLDSWAMECLTQCCAFSLWDQSAPATSSLSSSVRETKQECLIHAHDSDSWGNSSKASPYKWEAQNTILIKEDTYNHYTVWGKQETPKRQAGWKEKGLDFLTQWNLPGSVDWEAETPHDQPLVEEARERGWPCCLRESEVHALVFQWRGVEGKLKTIMGQV